MTRGWDGWGAPLAGGKVSWQATDLRNGRYAFRATYQVQGAEPNHQYQVGVHFFEPAGTTRAVVREFGGVRMPGARGPLAREGVTATYVGGFEFGMLSTDGRGNGSAAFEYNIPARAYEWQFTVRSGRCSPPSEMSGCGVVFRTGTRLAQELEVIRGPEAVSSGPTGRGGCGLTMEANTDRYAGDYQTLSTTNPEACCEACEGDARCQAFARVESQRTCYLKSTAPAARSAGGIASGVKKAGGATVSGVRYRIENFVHNSPDVYQNPRNFHDFVADFRGCRIQPLNPVYAAGQEEIRVLVCRERSRLTFPSRTPGSFVEYDWVFTNNGQTIHGAYRQGGSFGPIVGGIYREP